MFVLILFDFLQFYISAYTTLNELLAVFFIYNICGFIKVWKVTEQLLCTQQQQLLLPAGYITAKFHLSTSIGGQDIAVCAKIQDGGRRHLEFFCSRFWHFCM